MSDHRPWTNARSTLITWIGAALSLVGCGQDVPPYDDLPLRDALRASPEVVASLSFDTRLPLAQRLDAAALAEEGATTLDLPETVTIDSLARVADDVREDDGHDALIVGEVVAQSSDFVLHSQNIDAETLGQLTVGPIFLRGHPGALTAPLEETALRGRAGKWLRELSGRTNAKTMVRTTGVPFGAWAFDDKLYVNASWLVAMAALEEDVVVAGPVNGSAPPKKPLSVDYHPYNLPETIAECAQQVTQTCTCGTSCTHEVTDSSFNSAVDECAWVNEEPSHPAALCALALMSIDDVRACMESGRGQCAILPVTGADALLFVQSTDCMDLLDLCLRDGYIPQPPSGSGNGSGGVDCGSCSNCGNNCSNSNSTNSCSKCNDDCSSCNEDWSQCNDNCSDTNENCSNTESNAKNCGKCSVKAASEKSPLPAPFGSTFWLVAPAAYLWLRGRRRS
jgi:hypothetical protein